MQVADGVLNQLCSQDTPIIKFMCPGDTYQFMCLGTQPTYFNTGRLHKGKNAAFLKLFYLK